MGFGKDGNGQMQWDRLTLQALGTLASLNAIVFEMPRLANMISDFRMLRIEYALHWQGKTTDDGPIVLGLCVGATAAQVAEAMLSQPTDLTQLDEGNDANRAIWPLAVVHRKATEMTEATIPFGAFNPKWSTRGSGNQNGAQRLQLFAFNEESGALTTGMLIGISMKVAGVWVNDRR